MKRFILFQLGFADGENLMKLENTALSYCLKGASEMGEKKFYDP
jgi:hypothetical protein